MAYLERAIDKRLDQLHPQAPAIAIEGAKGVGKTETAARRAGTVWYLDDEANAELLRGAPELLPSSAPPVLLDEWQRLPSVWDSVRRWVDRGAPPGSVLLTGSATPASGSDRHSGAGRIISLHMRPMGMFERGLIEPTVSLAALMAGERGLHGESPLGVIDYTDEIVRSGFPGIRRAASGVREELLAAYVRHIIDRDIPDLGRQVRRPETLRRWIAAYAAASSTTTAYSKILDMTTAGDGSQPAKSSTLEYRDLLTQIFILDPIPGWSPARSPISRLQQAPKHQLVDPAIAAILMNADGPYLRSSRGAERAGQLFESLAALTVRAAADPLGARVGHLRTGNGDHEIDLIVEGRGGAVVAIEVKLSAVVKDSDVRHLNWLHGVLGDELVDRIVLTTGKTAYRRPDGVGVVPLALLGL